MQHARRRAYVLFMILDGLRSIIVPMFAKFCVTAGRRKTKITRIMLRKSGPLCETAQSHCKNAKGRKQNLMNAKSSGHSLFR